MRRITKLAIVVGGYGAAVAAAACAVEALVCLYDGYHFVVAPRG